MAKQRLTFGLFHAPYHLPMGQNPNLALHRDVELAKHLDQLGWDEIWFGEHHSCGCELIAEPLMMIAHVAPQTRDIKLGTGVLSLPYHNPLWVADRMILADHLTRGRVILGLGPGALTSDAAMIGIDPRTQRESFETDVDVLMRLLNGEKVSIETDRYKLVDAHVHLSPYSDFEVAVAATASPTGPRLAGKHGLSLLSIGATMAAQKNDSLDHWKVVEERAAEYGTTPDRSKWRVVAPFYIAETREKAIEEVQYGIDAWFDYFQDVQSAVHFALAGRTTEERIKFVNEAGLGVIGTADDAIAFIKNLNRMSDGGLGGILAMSHEWASWDNLKRSYAIMAERVIPAFNGSLDSLQASWDLNAETRDVLGGAQLQDVQNAMERHRKEQEAKAAARAGVN